MTGLLTEAGKRKTSETSTAHARVQAPTEVGRAGEEAEARRPTRGWRGEAGGQELSWSGKEGPLPTPGLALSVLEGRG